MTGFPHQLPPTEGGGVLAQLSQGAAPDEQGMIFPPPRVGAAVPGVTPPFQAGFIAVVEGGGAGEGEQKGIA